MHVNECRIIRCALQSEVLQNGLRKKAINIIRLCAEQKFDNALVSVLEYREMLNEEIKRVNATVEAVERLIEHPPTNGGKSFSRKETALELNITVDTLRNWELNGLIEAGKNNNGYRFFTEYQMQRLMIIRTLRCANYSLATILRLMNQLNKGKNISVDKLLNYPQDDTDVVTACDHLKEKLSSTLHDTIVLESLIKELQKTYPPL